MDTRRVSLALQGGGCLGAYSWGVLDVLLEEERFEIAGVTGSSVGAINAALLGDGFSRGGAAAARALLERFWITMGVACSARRRSRLSQAVRVVRRLRAMSSAAVHEFAISAMADFDIDPATMEPLRGVLTRLLDVGSLRRSPFPVFVNATAVPGIELRVFSREEMSVDVLCASACVPLVFDAVRVDGVAYWDGSFLGNPALFPVIENVDCQDIVLVKTTPRWNCMPRTAGDLLARISELGFAAALHRERRAIDFVSKLVRGADPDAFPGLRDVKVHEIPPHPALALERVRPFDAREKTLGRLHRLGREAAQAWLDVDSRSAAGLATAGDFPAPGASCVA